MSKISLILLICFPFIAASCYNYGYYQHPMQSITAYRNIPLKSDSLRSATYLSGSIIGGVANHSWRDEILGFSGSIHRAHVLGDLQFHYGLNGTIGKYRASDYSFHGLFQFENENLNPTLIDSLNGTKFFGSYGFGGGINWVKATEKVEARIIGIEFNWQHEWDNDYHAFRNKLPIDAANLIDYRRNYSSIAVTSEFIWRLTRNRGGYKASVGIMIPGADYYNTNKDKRKVYPGFLSQTAHVEMGKFLYYGQLTFGYRVANMHVGINYRLR
ncbi:MAG: hypothetical protein H7Y31_18590 [Chitinophagaceae bacterium]|nr:hypothetical protein [Chitinophagaceae bacterium]